MHTSFRRIDLVVAAGVWLGLTALAMPYLLLARETARSTQCQQHLAQLGIAFQQFETNRGGFPPRRSGFNDGHPYGGWGTSLYPYLDSNDADKPEYDSRFDFFDPRNKPAAEFSLPVMLCPASPEDRFVEIQSQASTKSANADKDTVFVCRAGVTDFIASNGVLMSRTGYGLGALTRDSNIGNQRQPMIDNAIQPTLNITDGMSVTLLLIEQAGRPTVWRNREQKEGSGQFGVSPNARGAWAGWGSIAFGAANADTGETPGKGDSTDCSVNCNNWFGIYGFHENGASVLFCDGSIRFMGRRLDPLTFAYLTIRDDGQAIDLDDF